MSQRLNIFLLTFLIFHLPLIAAGRHGYSEWHDQLNNYNFQEPQFHDVVPITPYENPNPIFYDYSPYLDPNYNADYANPE